MELLTAREVATLLRRTTDWVYRSQHLLPTRTIPGGGVRFDAQELKLGILSGRWEGMRTQRGSGGGSVTKRGPGRYLARKRLADGRRVNKTFRTESKAWKWLASITLTGEVPGPMGESTIEDLVEDFLVSRELRELAAGTLQFYRGWLQGKHSWGYRYREALAPRITRDHLVEWMLHRRKAGVSVEAIRAEVRALRAMFRWAEDEGRVTTVPTKGLLDKVAPRGARSSRKSARGKRALRPHELAALIELEPEPRYRIAWMLMGLQGLRAGEVQRATWEWVDLHNDELLVLEGKSRNDDVLPLAPWLRQELAGAGEREGFLVPGNRRGRPVWRWTKPLRRALKRIGLAEDHVTPHGLRRTFMTLLEADLEAPRTVSQSLLRHADEEVSDRYRVPVTEADRRWIRKLDEHVRASRKVRRLRAG